MMKKKKSDYFDYLSKIKRRNGYVNNTKEEEEVVVVAFK